MRRTFGIVAVLVMVLLGLVVVASAVEQIVVTKKWDSALYSDKFNAGTRLKAYEVTATGPFKSDGTPRPGATQWVSFSLWDYINSTWQRTLPASVPAACPSCTTVTVAPGSSVKGIVKPGYRVIVIHRGSTVADSAGVIFDGGEQ